MTTSQTHLETAQPLLRTEAAEHRHARPRFRAVARRLPAVSRFLLGVMFFVSGLNGFLNFIPPPAPDAMPPGAMAFAGALFQAGYMLPLVAGTQLLAGALLLANRFVPLALAILAPMLVNIIAFHVFLAPTGLAIPVVLLALELHLAWVHRSYFAPMLTRRAIAATK
jgi:uncharacterized membrane protein YphA (DoxX/SURF4 family)